MILNNKFMINLITLSLLIAAQIVYLILPFEVITGYALILPLIYLLTAVIYIALSGSDERPIPKKSKSIIIAGYYVMFYLTFIMITGLIYGFAKNMAAASLISVIRSIWIYGFPALITEVIRFRIIKSATIKSKGKMATLLMFIFTFLELGGIKDLAKNISYQEFTNFFFAAILPVFVLNAVLCYMAYESSLLLLIVTKMLYLMTPLLLPVLPNINLLTWSVSTSGVLIFSTIIYYILIDSGNAKIKKKLKRQAKYQKKSKLIRAIVLTVIIFTSAFVLRVFIYFPSVILTGSMTGTIDKGSIVFTKKINQKDIVSTIIEGDIILYSERNSEIMHRVIDIRYDSNGEPLYITKGDANAEADPHPIEKSQIIGVTKSFIPYLGYPIVVLKNNF